MRSLILRRLLKFKISSKSLNCGFASQSNIIKSALPDIEIPKESFSQFIFKDFGKFPHKVAVVSFLFFTLLITTFLNLCF